MSLEYKELIDHIAALNPKELKVFLDGLLTPTERQELTRRLQIVKQLKKGVAQHQIAEDLGVGVATVTRGSKEIKLGNFNSYNPWR